MYDVYILRCRFFFYFFVAFATQATHSPVYPKLNRGLHIHNTATHMRWISIIYFVFFSSVSLLCDTKEIKPKTTQLRCLERDQVVCTTTWNWFNFVYFFLALFRPCWMEGPSTTEIYKCASKMTEPTYAQQHRDDGCTYMRYIHAWECVLCACMLYHILVFDERWVSDWASLLVWVCVCSAMYVCSCDLCVREKRECWPSMRNANKIIYFCFHSHVFRYTQFRFHFIFHFPFRAELSWMVSTQQCRNIDSVSQIIQLRKNHMRIWEMCAYYTSCDMCVLLLQWNRTVLIQRLNAKGVKIAIANRLFWTNSQIILCESCACMTIYYAIIYQSRYALFVGGFNLFLHW